MLEKRKRQQRETDRRKTDRRQDVFKSKLEVLSGQTINSALSSEVSDARIEIRCPAAMKEDIESLAGRYGLTVTNYLLCLHELAASKLGNANARQP